jgi:hypothetical protein
LRSVVQGYFNYHAVPGNTDSLQSFRAQVIWHWFRALQRRSQKSRMTWERFGPLVARWIPSATILHPRPYRDCGRGEQVTAPPIPIISSGPWPACDMRIFSCGVCEAEFCW